jgi:hypothetical protein
MTSARLKPIEERISQRDAGTNWSVPPDSHSAAHSIPTTPHSEMLNRWVTQRRPPDVAHRMSSFKVKMLCEYVTRVSSLV